MCALSKVVYFYFMHTEFFFTDQHISKIGSHLLSSIVNYYVSSLRLDKQFIFTVVHSVWLKCISLNNSKYWYFVMSS